MPAFRMIGPIKSSKSVATESISGSLATPALYQSAKSVPKFDAVSMMWKLWAQYLDEFTTAGMDDLSASLHYSGEKSSLSAIFTVITSCRHNNVATSTVGIFFRNMIWCLYPTCCQQGDWRML